MARFASVACILVAVWLATASAQSCSNYANCYDCTTSNSGDCGWNDQEQQCSRGDTATGYPEGYGYTPQWWAWKVDRCCSQQTSCSTCTEVVNSRCSWHPNQNQCQYVGNGGGINSYSSCPSNSNCGYNWGCSSCLAQGGCGWDHNEQECMAGTSSGPYSGWSYSWYYNSCPAGVWEWRWSVNSASMWLTLCAIIIGLSLCCCACCAGRRRRRILREQNRLNAMYGASNTQANAPLMGQPVYHPGQPAPPAFYGTPGAAYTNAYPPVPQPAGTFLRQHSLRTR